MGRAMQRRNAKRWLAGACAAAVLAGALAPAMLAETPARAAGQQAAIPRTPDGKPDMQGIWTNRWLSPMERPAGVQKLVLDQTEAKALVQDILARAAHPDQLDPELAEPDAETLAIVRGEHRSSLVIDPPDGKLPYTPAGRAAQRAYIGGLDGPEQRMTTERCIGGVGWAPLQIRTASMLHRIVQTAGHMVIQTEAYDDTRVIPIGAPHMPRQVLPVGGDSIARWEGDALIVETRHPDPATSTHGIMTVKSPDSVVEERFEFNGPDEIVYRYTITDPAYYSKPWTVEYSMTRSDERMYEFACHAGNYSLTHMLAGARQEERAAK